MKSPVSLLLLGGFAILGTWAPARSAVHEVSMKQEGDHFVFQPAQLRVKRGDVVRFINVSGGPHNVGIDSTGLSEEVRNRFRGSMKEQLAPLAGPLLTGDRQPYDIVFEVPAGRYSIYCMPHLALGMTGTVTVE